MCRTLTALGVLYHNYRIVITPPPSQEGLDCMHDAGCREGQGLGGGLKGSGKGHSLGAMGESVQCSAVSHYSSAPDTL